jgi:hypothetical protein
MHPEGQTTLPARERSALRVCHRLGMLETSPARSDIHDWLGTGFVPNVKIEDILRIVRDYDRYKGKYFKPGIRNARRRPS